ncbi:uncharacterized protein LOC127791614 [Diospyros lotus]|uniref:uncharacterized protein LOC127791614 n=1 Tax=Diospyros lotus TaxID=55363 RepID=UPI00225129CE|nr:uncharacterized protein LOC127791614 [Diospyros lotus]
MAAWYIREVNYPEWLANVVLVPKGEGKFLGYIVHHRGIEVNPEKIKAILKMPTLRNIKECQEAFNELKACLASPPVLTKPRMGEPLYLYLAVADEGSELSTAEARYSPLEKLAFALVVLARKLRPYFKVHSITVLTDQPLRQVLGKPELSGRMLKWSMELTTFDIEYKPRSAIKAQALADFIVKGSGLGKSREDSLGPWMLAVDGSSNPRGGGAGLMIKSHEGQSWLYALHFEFRVSNNEAEYEALIVGLRLAAQLGARHLNNMEADTLSRIASASFPTNSRQIFIETLPQRSINEIVEQLCLDLEPSWLDPFFSYLKDGKLLESDLEARELKRKAQKFILINEKLYKRSFTQPLLRCVRPREVDYVLREIYEGICGSHIGARTLYQKALRQGYYWPTMVTDAEQLVTKSERCQRISNLIHVHSAMLAHLVQPCPFAQWGTDILGLFPPVASQVKFLIAAIDHFTKWIEAKPLASITARKVKQFLWKNVELGIKQHFTSVAHPQANEQIELANRTMLYGLKARVDEVDGSWVDELPSILWSYRTTRRGSIGETPFSLCYSSEALIPVEIGIPTFRVEHFDPESNEQDLRNNLDTVEEL